MCLGIPGNVVEIFREDDLLMGKVDFGGIKKRVCLEYLPELTVGEYVLVHVGFAIARIDEHEARQIFEFLSRFDELDELGNSDQVGPNARESLDVARDESHGGNP
jgi:hydrogenase expression/formation protein HypC